MLGLDADQVHLLNDDRVGRALLSLFDADRASLLNRMVLGAVAEFSIDCSQLHNGSTSVKLTGVYANATGVTREPSRRWRPSGDTPRTTGRT